MKKKVILALSLALAVSATAISQNAGWSVGARFGGMSGVSLKKYKRSNTSALELITGWSFDDKIDGFALTPMFEKMGPLTDSGRLCALFGPGLNLIWGDEFYFGASAMLGLDWRLGKIGFQFDWTPSYIFVNENYFSPINGAVTVRWLFGRS